jgi:hypothetical protein
MESVHREMLAVLTAPQRARLDSLHAAHHDGMAGHDMAAMHGDAGMCAAEHPSATETARPRG